MKAILGDGLMSAAAWQCVAACGAIAAGRAPSAVVSLAAGNQQALAARFVSGRAGEDPATWAITCACSNVIVPAATASREAASPWARA